MMAANYSTGLERDEKQLKRNDGDPRAWTNPLEVQLPRAPGMTIFCVYGVGKETERSYWYARGAGADDDAVEDSADDAAEADGAPARPRARTSWIDAEYTDASARPPVVNGVKMGEGDGTVSLLSLGAMCVDGWQRPRYNPAGIKVVTVEVRSLDRGRAGLTRPQLPHNPTATMPRGGANTSDHVDILGSTGLNEILVKVATGVGAEIEDNVVSNIREYSRKIKWDA
jgi:phospholipid:diacylglycerol acyltransferase